MNLLQITDGRQLSVLKNPFSVPCLIGIDIHWHKYPFMSVPIIWAQVEFQNGDTKGVQKLEAMSLPELLQKTEAFIKTLPGVS